MSFAGSDVIISHIPIYFAFQRWWLFMNMGGKCVVVGSKLDHLNHFRFWVTKCFQSSKTRQSLKLHILPTSYSDLHQLNLRPILTFPITANVNTETGI